MATNLTAEIILEGKYLGGQAVSQAIGDQQALHDKITANMAVMSRLTAESAAAVGAITQHANATTASATVMGQHTTMTAASAAGLGQLASVAATSGAAMAQHTLATGAGASALTDHAARAAVSFTELSRLSGANIAAGTAVGQHTAAVTEHTTRSDALRQSVASLTGQQTGLATSHVTSAQAAIQHAASTATVGSALGQHASAVGVSVAALGQHVVATTQSGAVLSQHATTIASSGSGFGLHAVAAAASSTTLTGHTAAAAASGTALQQHAASIGSSAGAATQHATAVTGSATALGQHVGQVAASGSALQQHATHATTSGAALNAHAGYAGTAGGALGLLQGSAEKAGGALGSLGGLAAQGFGLGLGLQAVQALSNGLDSILPSAVHFETEMNRLKQNTGLTTSEMVDARKEILALSAETGASTDVIALGWRHVRDITHDASISTGIADIAMKSAISTGGDGAQTANILARAMHEYAQDTSSAATATDRHAEIMKNANSTMAIFHTAAQMADMTLQQFSDNSARAIGLSAQLGIAINEPAAALAALTLHGFDAAGAQVQYVDSLIHMVNPTKAATTELTRLSNATGIDVVGAFSAAGLKAHGYIGVLDILDTALTKGSMTEYESAAVRVQLGLATADTMKAIQGLGLSQENVTAETMKVIQAQRGGIGSAALLTVGSKDLHEANEKLIQAGKDGTVTQEAWNDTMLTTEQRWKIFTNNLQLGTMAVGAQFLPAMNAAIGALTDAGPKIGAFAGDIRDKAAASLQGMADKLATTGAAWAPWASQAGAAGTVVSASLTGVSGVVQALQLVLQGNYTAAWKTAQGAMGDFGGALDAVGRILDSNRNLILGVGAALGAFAVLSTVVPSVIAFGAAIGGVVTVLGAAQGAAGVLGVIVGILGGPVTLAIAGVALAVGALTVAWVNNFGDIQGKTAAVASTVGGSLAQFGADLRTTGAKAAGLRDDINAAFDPINANIDAKAKTWTATLAGNWDKQRTDAAIAIVAFNATVGTGFAALAGTLAKWQTDTRDAIVGAFKDTGVAAAISTLSATIMTGLGSIRKGLDDWSDGIRNKIGDAFSKAGTAISQVATEGPSGSGAGYRSSQFDPSLSPAEALAACGPTAVVAFARANGGRIPSSLKEVVDAASNAGLSSGTTGGMNGPGSEQALLEMYGMSSTLSMAPTQGQIELGAGRSGGEIISTPGHYFTASGYDANTGKYDVGTSGSDLKGGSTSMTLGEMTQIMGPVQAILTDIKSNTGGTAAVAPGKGYDPSAYGNGGTAAIPSPGDTEGWAKWLKNSGSIPSDLVNDPKFLNILLTGGRAESGLDASKVQGGYAMGSGKGARGLFQFDMAGMGAGQSEEFLTSAAGAQWQAQQIVPEYAKAYRSSSAQGMTGAQQAAFVASAAEKPFGNYPGGAGWNNYVRNFQAGPSDAPGGGYDPAAIGVRTAPQAVAAAAGETPGLLDATSGDPTGVMARQKAGKDAAAPHVTRLTGAADAMGDWLTKSQASEANDLAKLDRTGQREIDKIMPAAQDKVADQTASRLLAQQNKDAKDALQERQADQLRAFQEQQAAALLVNKRVDEDARISQSRVREDQRITANEGLAAEARRHTQVLQDADIQHQKTLQLEATAHTYKLQDAKILADERLALTATEHSRRLQDEQQLVNEKLALQQTLHQRGLQDQALADGAVLSATASVHSRGLQDKEAAYQHVRSLDKEADSYAQQLANATTDVQRKAIEQRHQDALKTQADQWAEALVQTAHARQLQDEEAKYQEGLRVIALQKSRVQADIEQKYKDGLADSALQDSRRRADTEAQYQLGLRATALATARGLAEQEQQYKDGLNAAALVRTRGLQDVEVEYQRGVARAALLAKRADEDAARAEARAKEDADIKAKMAADKIARDFAKQQKDEMQALDRLQSDAAFKLSTDRMLADAAQAKADRTQRLIDDKIAVVEKYDAERKAHLEAFKLDAAGIKALAKTAVEAAGGDFAPIAAKMDAVIDKVVADYGKGHDVSVLALADLATQTATATAEAGKSLGKLGTAAVTTLGEGSPVVAAIEVSDQAVELFAQQFGLSWDVARPLLGQIEQGITTNMGANGLIPKAVHASDKAVEEFAQRWGISWNEARPILDAESSKIIATFGNDVPSVMAKAATEAGTLNTAIQGIQDKEIRVTTNYISQGSQAASGAAGAMVGGQGGSRSGGGEAAGGPGPNAPISSGGGSGNYDFSTYSGRQAARDANPGAVVDAGGIYRPPGHAAGGPMNQGDVSIVGERGPELFKAGSQGYVFPSGTSMGGSNQPIDYDRLAQAVVQALNTNGRFAVAVSDIHAQLLQMARRNGGAGLA